MRRGPHKGEWRKYEKNPQRKRGPWERRATAAAEFAAAPFALAWRSGRWAWRKTRKGAPVLEPEPAAGQAAEKTPDPGKPVPEAQPESGRPEPVRKLHDYREGPTIMNHIDAAGEAAAQHIGSWEPENATDLDMFLSSLPGYFETVAGAFRTVASKLADGYPVHPSVPERLNDIASTIAGMADFSGEAHAAHRAQHEREMDRINNPRNNEAFWDVSQQ